MKARKTTSREGFTLIEMLVSLTLLAIVMGSVLSTTQRGFAIFRRSSANGDLNSRAARATDRLSREVIQASAASFNPNLDTPIGLPTVWSESLEFQDAVGWAGNALVLDTARRITWQRAAGELDNGLDDNGDGRIDEGFVQLVLDPAGADPQTVTLARGVSEYLEGETPNGLDDNGNGMIDERGLAFRMDGQVLTISLSLESIGPAGELMVRTQESTIQIRN